jgi:hypothetical protein
LRRPVRKQHQGIVDVHVHSEWTGDGLSAMDERKVSRPMKYLYPIPGKPPTFSFYCPAIF